MTRFSKFLVTLGAAAMATSPVVASASSSTLPAMLQGSVFTEEENNGVLTILGVVVIAGGLYLLVKGKSKSK